MDFSNLTKEQVEWIKGLVEKAWYDAYNKDVYAMTRMTGINL